ncbi:alpha-L-arabinofuranosidase C-terminal domain-containing protein [Niabella hibiscisoli]|uniref:alpha-L-arabinofuranosidase C-terminal domain-containing protein n=1 Tax=Niabella hibiscisoli TaxID=1825928 RepID=UPI00374D632A
METALSEALHLNNLERNGDVVAMSSYAPLFAKEGFTQWNPDLIYFTNTEVKLTPGYYVQHLYGNSPGNEYIPAQTQSSNNDAGVMKRLSTSIVRNTKTNELMVRVVNLLPVTANISLNLSELPTGGKAQKTVLTGNPADRKVVPVTDETHLQAGKPEQLPPYSLTIWKIKL